MSLHNPRHRKRIHAHHRFINPVLPGKYYSTAKGVLQYFRGRTTVLPGEDYSTAKEVLARHKHLEEKT